MRYAIERVNGLPSLVFEDGQTVGTLISWKREDDNLAVTAGNIMNTVLLNDRNCNLPQVRQDLAALLTRAL